MAELKFTLLTDGSSDRVLLPILEWLLIQNGVSIPLQPFWADLRNLRKNVNSLSDRIKVAIDLYPCDLLFIHRDAERERLDVRKKEIKTAFQSNGMHVDRPYVCVIPVRMTEAWLLFDMDAIRRASGNSASRIPLDLPLARQIEALPNPKEILYEKLKMASELRGRRLNQFPIDQRALRITQLINDFSPLRQLPAFSALERDVKEVITQRKWNKLPK